MTTHYLHTLTLNQLLSILRHVRLGHEYLSKKLNQNDYKNLLSLGRLSDNQLKKMQSDKQEAYGNLIIIVLAILTSIFGGWLGFNTFNHSSIISWVGFIIVISAMGFGLITGYLGYTLTHRQGKHACEQQQLCNVQLMLIEIIINSTKNKIEKTQTQIYNLLKIINKIEHNYDNCSTRILQHLSKLEIQTNNHPYAFLIEKSINSLQKNIAKLNNKAPFINKNDCCDTFDLLLKNPKPHTSYIKILATTEVTPKKVLPKINTWLKKRTGDIIVGLLPIFLGTLASMFVFLNGIPALLSAFDVQIHLSESKLKFFKEAALFFSFLISLYCSYSHLHSNYKVYKREKELQNFINKINDEDHEMLMFIEKSHYWSRIHYHLKLLFDLTTYQKSENQNSSFR
ncbi:MAG TPA: hypothetical protein VHM20_02790 [Gammaproteobacteria bacterium]|jgi:hypothetical protein|nr:hypothetical protein [Gammaproteobacteria bacterium]